MMKSALYIVAERRLYAHHYIIMIDALYARAVGRQQHIVECITQFAHHECIMKRAVSVCWGL
jgi:hypothetical protein